MFRVGNRLRPPLCSFHGSLNMTLCHTLRASFSSIHIPNLSNDFFSLSKNFSPLVAPPTFISEAIHADSRFLIRQTSGIYLPSSLPMQLWDLPSMSRKIVPY